MIKALSWRDCLIEEGNHLPLFVKVRKGALTAKQTRYMYKYPFFTKERETRYVWAINVRVFAKLTTNGVYEFDVWLDPLPGTSLRKVRLQRLLITEKELDSDSSNILKVSLEKIILKYIKNSF